MDNSKDSFYGRIADRAERMDSSSLQHYMRSLLREKGFLEQIFNSIREGIIVIDNHLKIRIINQAACAMFAVDTSVIGQPIAKYFKHFNWETLRLDPPASWGKFSRRQLEVFYPEHRHLSFYLLPVHERPDMDQPGLPLATLILHDITESTQASESDLETQKIKAITQLAAGVAHELGNPLNTLGIHLQILRRRLQKKGKAASMPEVLEFVDVAEQELSRLDGIVKNFLNAVRPDKLNRGLINLRQLLSEAVSFMRPEIENKKIVIDAALPDHIPALMGDAGQLTQAFYNLVKNAIQAMPDGGLLQILCSVDDVFVHITFADSGKGLNENDICRLLEPYYTTKSSGTGLGLLIVDRIVRAHGGELTIEGSPGQGATFTISLPRHARIIRQIPETPASEPSSAQHDPA